MARKKIQITCDHCNALFEKEERYVKAAAKKCRRNFCSRACSAKGNKVLMAGRPENLWKGRKNTELSPYGYYVRKARSRGKCNITAEEVRDQWLSQKGKCAFSGMEIKLHGQHTDLRDLASLDRIDSSLPYQKGNVQFVIGVLNLAKSDMDDTIFRSFLTELKNHL